VVKTFHQVNDSKNTTPTSSAGLNPTEANAVDPAFTPKTFHQQQSSSATSTATSQDNHPAPKALFQPTVENHVDDNSRQWLETAIARLELDDYQFADTELSRANLLQKSIQLHNPSFVTEYGAEASQQSESILNQLNTLTRSDYADGVRKYLALILEATQKVDIDAISQSQSPSFFNRLFNNSVNSKPKFIELERDIKTNVSLCQDRLNHLKKSQQIFGELFQKNEQQFRSLTIYLLAGQLRLEQEQQDLLQQPTESKNLFAQQAQLDKKDNLARFERRLYTLKILRHTVLLRMGQLRLEQKNTLMLIDHANETINLVIPAWRQQVLALFSLSPNDNVSELYEKLATTQQTLQKNLLSLK
jgi:uncharacterized protein YaaN involved in tellurite resistance